MDKRRLLDSSIALAVAIAAVTWLVSRSELDAVGEILRTSDWLLVAAALLLSILHYAPKALRWRVLVGADRLPIPLAVRLTYIGFLANNFLPARAGELARPWLLNTNRPDIPFAYALATVVGEKVFDLLATALCLLFASLLLPLPDYARAGAMAVGGAAVLGIGAGVAAAWGVQRGWFGEGEGRLRTLLLRFAEGIAPLASPRAFFWALVHTCVGWALLLMSIVLCLRAVGLPGRPLDAVFVVGMVGIGFALPSPPTHAGTFHVFATQALELSGSVTPDHALSFAILAHGVQVTATTLGGLLALPGVRWRGFSADSAAQDQPNRTR